MAEFSLAEPLIVIGFLRRFVFLFLLASVIIWFALSCLVSFSSNNMAWISSSFSVSTPITQLSLTCGILLRIISMSSGYTFIPADVTITSFFLPLRNRNPSLSRVPKSPVLNHPLENSSFVFVGFL